MVGPPDSAWRAVRNLPPGLIALAISGALLGHEVGYLTHRDTLGHGYLGVAAPVALLAVVAMVWRLAVNIVRRTEGAEVSTALPSLRTLAGAQSALYLAFEVGERLVGETGTPLWSLPVAAGLIAQPVVAWLALRLLRLGSAVLESLIERPTRAAPSRRAELRRPLPQFAINMLPLRLVARGPPRLI